MKAKERKPSLLDRKHTCIFYLALTCYKSEIEMDVFSAKVLFSDRQPAIIFGTCILFNYLLKYLMLKFYYCVYFLPLKFKTVNDRFKFYSQNHFCVSSKN